MADKNKAGTSSKTKTISAPFNAEKGSVAKKGQLDSVAASLRRAYDDTVNESVPDSMMDLLRRLG